MTRVIKTVNRALHYVAGALIIGVMAFTVYNVIGRWLFNAPLRGTVELTEIAMIGIVYLGLAYAQHQNNHIAVNLLYQRLGRTARLVLDVFTTALSMLVLALVAWRLYDYAAVLESGGRTTASRGIPLYPFAYLAIVGVVAFIVAYASTLIEHFRGAGPDDDSGDDSGGGPGDSDAPAGPDVTTRAPL